MVHLHLRVRDSVPTIMSAFTLSISGKQLSRSAIACLRKENVCRPGSNTQRLLSSSAQHQLPDTAATVKHPQDTANGKDRHNALSDSIGEGLEYVSLLNCASLFLATVLSIGGICSLLICEMQCKEGWPERVCNIRQRCPEQRGTSKSGESKGA